MTSVRMRELRAGMTLARRRVLIEQGPVAQFADVLGVSDPVHRSAVAGREAGFAGAPIPPTYTFVMWFWGAHDDLQSADPDADFTDLSEISAAMSAGGGQMLHGEQEFRFHRQLAAGETVEMRGTLEDVTEKTRRDGQRMTIARIRTDVTGADGACAAELVTTLICVLAAA
jgi:acyl dehydratase